MSQSEVESNFIFMRRCEPCADRYYEREGYTATRVTGSANKWYDVLLTRGPENTSVEEKWLRDDLNIVYVETMQDVDTNNPGWLSYTRAEYILYAMPSVAYMLITEKLRWFVRRHGEYCKTIVSTKGWGKSRNILMPIGCIESYNVGEPISLPTLTGGHGILP